MRAKRRLQADDRGVSEVIGAILVFGLVIALMAILQTQAIPAANEEVEFNHNQDVQSDLIQFKEASSRTIATGTTESTRIRMGTTYPSRMLFFNPSNPSGNIRTTGAGEASIHNIESPNNDVNGYIGDDNEIAGLETKRLEYQPNYNEYTNPPVTVMEYGALYSDFEEEDKILVKNHPDVVNGNTIDLTFFGGDLGRTTAAAMSLESRPTSAPARTVTIRPSDENTNITLNITSRMPAEQWNKSLSDEDNFISAIQVSDEIVEIELRPTRYQLRMAKVGVGSGVKEPGPEYITRASEQTGTMDEGSAQQLPIEVRDKYNNPVSGVKVNVSVSSGDLGGKGQQANATTDDSGRPMIVYSPSDSGRVRVNASFANDPESDNFDPDSKEDTQFYIAVSEILNDNPPSIDEFDKSDWEWECGTTFQIDLSTNPTFSDTSCAFIVEYDVSDVDSNLDTVEVRMIRNDTRSVVDSRTIDIRSSEGDGDERRMDDGNAIELIDQNPGNESERRYDIKVIATDQRGLRGTDQERDIDASDTQTQDG